MLDQNKNASAPATLKSKYADSGIDTYFEPSHPAITLRKARSIQDPIHG